MSQNIFAAFFDQFLIKINIPVKEIELDKRKNLHYTFIHI